MNAFLMGKGFHVLTPDALEEVTKPFLDEVWEYNAKDKLADEIGVSGAVTGDVFLLITYEEPTPLQRRVNPFSQGRIRINLLGSEQVYPTWDPLNMDTLIAVRIETIYYAERGTRQLDREDRVNHEGRQLYTKRFTQIITPDQIVEQYHGDMPVVRQNVLGEIPMVHIQNLPLPKEYYGLPDAMDIVDLQRELNEKATDISDIINYHSSPTIVITGAKAKQLEKGARQIWSGLPAEARVSTLGLQSDLGASHTYLEFIKKAIHELSDVPEGSLGSMQPISNTSGVALHLQYQPLLERRRRKTITYGAGLEQVNYFILRIAMVQGLINLPFDICSRCGGRIIEVRTGETTKVWDAPSQSFVDMPVRKKKCYHIDKQTLEFTDPYDMRIKMWRTYGFGKEIRELPYRQALEEIANTSRSFWDYTVLQEKMQQEWVQKNSAHLAAAMTPPSPPPEEGGAGGQAQGGEGSAGAAGGAPAPAPVLPPLPGSAQAAVARAVHPQLPPPHQISTLPPSEIDVPEEPEQVFVLRQWINPETGQVALEEQVPRFLVPTGCKRPAYLNPFETKVEFPDPLPKDEALQAQLYFQYQQAGWVDEEWCRSRIPEIAASASEISRRLKLKDAALRMQTPAQVTQMTGEEQKVYMEQAPPMGPQATIPGQGGNPIGIHEQAQKG